MPPMSSELIAYCRSKPPADGAAVRVVLLAELLRKNALLGTDLEAVDVEDEGGNPRERRDAAEVDGPGEEQQGEAQVHGIAREAIRAGAHQRRGRPRGERTVRRA